MKKVIVLGAGLVGNAIAADLATDCEVTCADISPEALAQAGVGVRTVLADVSQKERLHQLVAPFDLVVGAVPGFMGFETVRTVIEAGKNMVDISFFPEDPFLLHDIAKQQGVTVVTDCGVAPGMGNIFLGYHNQRMAIDRFECLVGGLPEVREWPLEYKAVFSPIDVIEEYTRPARYVHQGALVVREALSDAELVHFAEVGTLEAWNSDGLRSLLHTMPHIPNMIEKTLRYPGTIEYLRVLRTLGFFSSDPVTVKGQAVRPVDLTAQLLFPAWKLKPGEREFTVMRIVIEGNQDGQPKTYRYSLLDRTDNQGRLSMARTTGYTCTAAVHLVLQGQFNRPGINPPEFLGESETHFRFILNYLHSRGVHYQPG